MLHAFMYCILQMNWFIWMFARLFKRSNKRKSYSRWSRATVLASRWWAYRWFSVGPAGPVANINLNISFKMIKNKQRGTTPNWINITNGRCLSTMTTNHSAKCLTRSTSSLEFNWGATIKKMCFHFSNIIRRYLNARATWINELAQLQPVSYQIIMYTKRIVG